MSNTLDKVLHNMRRLLTEIRRSKICQLHMKLDNFNETDTFVEKINGIKKIFYLAQSYFYDACSFQKAFSFADKR